MSPAARFLGGAAAGLGGAALRRAARGYVGYRWRSLKRDASRPWREGGDEDAARLGRWIGVSLAVGAKAFGAAAAVYVVMRRR